MTEPKTRPDLWSDAEIKIIRTGWANGLSCREISNLLPRHSRCAVAAKAARLGLSARASSINHGVRTLRGRTSGVLLAGPSWSHPERVRA